MRLHKQLARARYGLPVLLLAILALLPCPARGSGRLDPVRAIWLTTDFQVVNLRADAELFSAVFLNPAGAPAGMITGTLPAGGAHYFGPGDLPVPGTFSGTLVLMTPGEAAVGVVHLETSSNADGNEVFAGVADETVTKTAYLPVDLCTTVHIHNPSLLSDAQVLVVVLDDQGGAVGGWSPTVLRQATTVIRIASLPSLPSSFFGSAVVLADVPIMVTARYTCGGLASFPAATRGAGFLSLPRVPQEVAGQVTTTISVQDTAPMTGTGRIYYSGGYSESFSLQPYGTVVLRPPSGTGGGPAVLTATVAIVAVQRTIANTGDEQGLYMVRAFNPSLEATEAAALPVLFSGSNGWSTGNRIWLKNAGPVTATIKIRYVSIPDGSVFWQQAEVGPGQVWQTSTPPMPAGRAAAIALADQPILALAGAIDLSPSGNVSDRQLRYRGMNFSFDCPAVTGTDFAWYPATPVAGLPLTLMASSAPESHQPVSYRWQVGNSLPIAGQLIRRVFFMEPGTYTVTVTASNCLDFHQERRSRALTVVPAPGRAYLPLLFKGHK